MGLKIAELDTALACCTARKLQVDNQPGKFPAWLNWDGCAVGGRCNAL
jgi:hypothetical protein